MTRNGAPFHGATGEGKTARSAASAQVADAARAGDSAADTDETANPAANKVVAATANQRARSMRTYPLLKSPRAALNRANVAGYEQICGEMARVSGGRAGPIPPVSPDFRGACSFLSVEPTETW
jgi:hypothetical protein